MLMIVMSLAISLVSIQAFHQQEKSSNQTPGSQRVQQEKKDMPYPTILNLPSVISVKPIALPAGDNAWAVQIVSRGGFAGSGRGDLTVTSEGTLIWSGADGSCSRRLTDETMQALAKVVLAADAPASSSQLSPSGLCADCYVTAMILQQRIGSGAVCASAVWDDATQAKVTTDVMTVYEALMAQRGCKLQ